MRVVLLISNDCFNRLRIFCSVLSAGFSCCLCLRFMREKFHGLCSHGLECPWCEPHFCFDPIPGMAFTYMSFKSLTLPCNYIAHIWSLEYGSCMWLTSSGQHVHAGARFHNQSILLRGPQNWVFQDALTNHRWSDQNKTILSYKQYCC